jgi:hypothetical protein
MSPFKKKVMINGLKGFVIVLFFIPVTMGMNTSTLIKSKRDSVSLNDLDEYEMNYMRTIIDRDLNIINFIQNNFILKDEHLKKIERIKEKLNKGSIREAHEKLEKVKKEIISYQPIFLKEK